MRVLLDSDFLAVFSEPVSIYEAFKKSNFKYYQKALRWTKRYLKLGLITIYSKNPTPRAVLPSYRYVLTDDGKKLLQILQSLEERK